MLPEMKFHHIGYAVKSIEDTASFYVNGGWSLSNTQYDPIQKTYIAFLIKDGFPLIELVAPYDETSPINNTLKKIGVTTYHICYSVPNIEKAVNNLRSQRFIPLFAPVAAVAMGGRICYLMHPKVGLIELLEE